jgi:hypothetical protein
VGLRPGVSFSARGRITQSRRLDDGFDGGLIERVNADRYKVYWKVECRVSRFALQAVNEFDALSDAARERRPILRDQF